jgi:phosphoenolpyruvate-protein kinase (PTS system EI component)
LAAKQARISALSKQLADPASQLLSGQKLELERTLANIDREQVGPLKNNRENFITHDRDLTLLIHAIIKFVKAREMGEHRDEYEQGSVHVADNLSWQEIKDLYDQGAAGFILDANKVGSGNHAVIFARNNDIPIVWIPEAARRFQTGDRLSIDAKKGLIVINPDRSVVDRLAVDEREYKRLNVLAKKSWRPEKDRVTLDQPPRPLPLLQHNLLDANNIFKDRKAGDRVGLFRTEGLYDQVRPFKHGLITTFQDLIEHTSEINIRLLDIAEDKWPGFFGDQEKDQFLGTQGGIDYLLNTKLGKALLYDQLKSILIAASRVRHRPQYAKKVRILIPKVIDWQQIEDVRNQLFSIMAEPGQVIGQGFKLADLEIAAMVETAEAVERIEEIAQHCDYLSLGTNDLTQAIMGFSERSRLMTSPETDWLSPAVLTAIRKVIAAGKKFGKPVGCCGEMAKDPLGAILLMLMGLDALSMDSHNLHEINYILSHIRISEWEKLGPPGVIDELLAKKEDGAFVFNAATLRKRLFELINQRHADTSINLQGFIAPRPITYLMA